MPTGRPFTITNRRFRPSLTRPLPPPSSFIAEVEAEGLDVSLHGGSAYPHDKSAGAGKLESGLGGGLSSDMVDRKIAEVRLPGVWFVCLFVL